jgi:hypothetical protein
MHGDYINIPSKSTRVLIQYEYAFSSFHTQNNTIYMYTEGELYTVHVLATTSCVQ